MGNTFSEDGSNPIRRNVLPWEKKRPETEQVHFVERWQQRRVSFVELCRQFGISRKTGYKRVRRFEEWGWDGLGDRSRAPRCRPNRTSQAVAERLIRARLAYPTWGPKKLVARLRALEPKESWPAPSTAGNILERAGLVKRRKRRRHASPWSEPFAAAERPNDVWSIDWKGWFRTGDGVRIDPLTVQDAALSVPVGLRWAVETQRAASTAGSGASLSGVRTSSGHPDRQRAALRQCWIGEPVVAGGMVGQAGHRT